MARDVKKFYDFIGKGDRKEADFYPTPDWMADNGQADLEDYILTS